MKTIIYLGLIFAIFFISEFVDQYFHLSQKSPIITALIVSTISAIGIVKPGEMLLKDIFAYESQQKTKNNLATQTRDTRGRVSDSLNRVDERINTMISTESISKKDLVEHCTYLSRIIKPLISDYKSLSNLIEDKNEY